MTTVLDIAYAANDVYRDANGGWRSNAAGGRLKRGQYRWNVAVKYVEQLKQTPYYQWLDTQNFADLDIDTVLFSNSLTHKRRHLDQYLRDARSDAEKMRRLKWFLACYATKDTVENTISKRGQQEGGMYAATYVSQSDNTKIIAFRGSEFNNFAIDWWFNLHLFTTYKTQFESALKFAEAAIKANNWKREDVVLCGHSLGGGLAKYVAFIWSTCAKQNPKATFAFNAPKIKPGLISFPISSVIAMAGAALGRGTLWGKMALPDLNRPFKRDDLGPCVGINTLLDPVSWLGGAIAPQKNMWINPFTDLPKGNSLLGTLYHHMPIAGSHSMVNVICALENSNKCIGTRNAMEYLKEMNPE